MPRSLRLLALLTVLALPLRAQSASPGTYPGLETGKMWTFDAPPLDYWAQRYAFTPPPGWLDHARLSAVRYANYCSASFVSGDGLVMTNHHCARDCVESATKEGEDLLQDGFYAARREDERPCQGIYLDQLQAISDVTPRVTGAVPAKASPETAADLVRKAIAAIQDECNASASDAYCQVVTMYRGGQYKLYRFRRFTDVRLVFAVESQIAFFGGDPDNFTYPRYDLDMSFVRAYVDGQPAQTEHFTWSRNGSREDELIFVIGNPGSTGRLLTVSQLEFLRNVQYPAQLAAYRNVIGVYKQLSATDEGRAKALRNTLFSLENSQKAVTGYQSGLLDSALMARKRDWESQFQGRVKADPAISKPYSGAWKTITQLQKRRAEIDVRRRYYSFNAYGSKLLPIAGIIVRYPVEMAKPDSARLPIFRDANRAQLERTLYSPAPIDPVTEAALLGAWFTAMQGELPPSDPVVRAALEGQGPDTAAQTMVDSTSIITVDQRKALIEGGAAAIQASIDPFVVLARVIDPLERQIQSQVTALNDQEAVANEQIAKALLAVYGNTVAPDATFSLRISDGEVRRYPMNGTIAPPYTTYYGLYERNVDFAAVPPFDLPPRWQAVPDSFNLAAEFNAASTNDIIGGNSGSPVINATGEVVGLIFDGNIESLPLRFLFSEARGRSIWVDSRGIIEALRRVYGAKALANELQGVTGD